METLNVGMYIRTKDGMIDKVIIDYNGHCASPNCECKHISCAKNYYDEDKIKKASYDIIDILEVWDYVNRREIVDIFYDANDNVMNVCVLGNIVYDNNEIKSVITHEQMEQMAYKVEE